VSVGPARVQQLAEIAADGGDTRIGRQVRRRGRAVDEDQPRDRLRLAARDRERAGRQQLPGKACAQEACAASDQHVRHVTLPFCGNRHGHRVIVCPAVCR